MGTEICFILTTRFLQKQSHRQPARSIFNMPSPRQNTSVTACPAPRPPGTDQHTVFHPLAKGENRPIEDCIHYLRLPSVTQELLRLIVFRPGRGEGGGGGE